MVADPISLAAYRLVVANLLAKSFTHWSRMDPEEFAEKVVRMPGDHGSTRPFSFDYFPPQREMYRELFNPLNREVVYEIASRLTKTTTVLAAIGYWIKESPRKILVNWPKVGDAEKWSKDQLMGELVDTTPELSEILGGGAGRRLAHNTILAKRFPGGYIQMFGANVPGDYRRAKGNVLYAEEIDAIQTTLTDEGDQLRQFVVRGSEYEDTIGIYASYPGLKGDSRIDDKYEHSDKRRYPVPCLECGYDEWIMHRRDMRYEKDNPAGARVECPHKHCLHDDGGRYKMMRAGHWKATAEFRGVVGFHANCLLWPHPVSAEKYPGGFLQMLAQEEIDADNSDNPERARRVIVNTRDAEPYEPEHLDKIEHTTLYLRREEYEPREMLPAEVFAVACGIDLQGDRAELKIKGFGGKFVDVPDPKSKKTKRHLLKQSWAIDYRIVPGSPLQPELWERLENLLRNTSFPHPSGKHLDIRLTLFDSGYKPDLVYAFSRKMRGLGIRVYPCAGSVTLGAPMISRPVKRGNPPCPVYVLGTHEAKDIIYQQVAITDPKLQGYRHFPATAPFNEWYFEHLLIEDSLMKRGENGQSFRFFFKKDDNDRNEPLDTEVYADAAERVLNPQYETLAEELRVAEAGADRKVTAAPPPVAPPNRGGLGRGWRL